MHVRRSAQTVISSNVGSCIVLFMLAISWAFGARDCCLHFEETVEICKGSHSRIEETPRPLP